MTAQTFIPSLLLQPYVKSYIIIESETDLINRILPGTAPVIALRFKGKVNLVQDSNLHTLPASFISGLRKAARLINYTAGAGNLLVQFREGGMAAFFKLPAHELFDESVSLEYLLPNEIVDQLQNDLSSALHHQQRIATVESFLLTHLSKAKPDDLIATALHHIHLQKGNIKVKELAAGFYISQDAFEKRFRKIVGTTPKQFASLVRLQNIIQQKPKLHSLTEAAYEGGFFDQAHFNKEFKLFTGLTPSEYFSLQPLW